MKNLLYFFITSSIFTAFSTKALAPPSECPDPPEITISPDIPSDVCIPTGFTDNPIVFFDDFSWKSFIALVWPAKEGQRGVADKSKKLGDGNGPLVFETYKAEWEVFQPNGATPSEWGSYEGENPCPNVTNVSFDDLILSSFSKFGNLGQAGFGNLVGPLVAVNNTYVRYLTGFNEIEYNQIRTQKLYLEENLKNITFQNGAIDVKSSWIDMDGIAHPERYYTRKAWMLDLVNSSCSLKIVGLVGIHIVQKTPSRPQWIWSSFEQVDNVSEHGALAPFTFNKGDGVSMPNSNPIPFPPPNVPSQIFNVDRMMPINPSTVATNAKYQDVLKNEGSGVWQFYQLVMTQWPVPGNTPANPGTPAFTFPGLDPPSGFANTTMETFDQIKIRTGCMNCHNFTKKNTDFLWTLQVNAFKPSGNAFVNTSDIMNEKSIKKLKKLMESTQTNR